MKQIDEKLINYSVYRDGTEWLGTADVQLPAIEALTETVKGAGIAGEVDTPTLGHFGAMSVTLNWRTMNASNLRLSQQKTHALDFRGAVQNYNSATGQFTSVGVKVSVRAMPKKTDPGKLEAAAAMGSSNELEVTYLKIMVDGKKLVEIDKFNFIAEFDGVDALAAVREQLGM
ncbi:phage major tail tube protein [Tumebacillus flagellatus]|uniref:Tail protein n=1 Tax=Tumebacillus flagellatus TaxID=1157490 RepID=A0A074MGB9_9BACL|nr:phage major tail tube protein [Tumebacillus flagellatus]KEO84757.1 tail protein [Tumebacillus flagellatus]